MTRLCVAIFVRTAEQAKRDIVLAGEAGAEMVELRIDTFNELVAIRELCQGSALPTIVTRRPTWEGGQSVEPEGLRLNYLKAIGVAGRTPFIDVELKSLGEFDRADVDSRLIVSS